MNRKEFLKKSVYASSLAGLYVATGRYGRLLASMPNPTYDLVAVKGGEPDVMFDKGINALGGMESFVSKGSKVVVKPNIGWDVSPERAGNTNPKLVSQIIRRCYGAGAKEVTVFDHTCDNWQGCYKNSGIERAVKDAGGKIAPGHTEGYYQSVTVANAKRIPTVKVHELILDADVFINVPILKSHSSARLTIAMKNLMGIVWDRGEWHREDLHQCIADFAGYARKPDLNIVDAYCVMKKNGPRGVSTDDVVMMRSLLMSHNMVTVDAAAAKLFGYAPSDIPHIQLAAEKGLGRVDLDKLTIKRIAL
jgi:uncharacterized protein (DUF362 family)